MSQQGKSLAKLGYIFGLGAFRRYEQHFNTTIAHFDETFKPTKEMYEAWLKSHGKHMPEANGPLPFRTISDVEVNHRWAVMLKYAHDVWLIENDGEPVTVDEVEMLIDAAPQSDWDAIREQYLDSSYLGHTIGEAITTAHQLGYKSKEIESLTLIDFVLALEGYRRRTEEQWDMVRHIMLYTRVYGGMGSEDPVSVTDVMTLVSSALPSPKPTARHSVVE